jgi:hypothetical protein
VGGVLDDDAVSDVSETLYDLVKAFEAEEISEGDQARFLTNMLTTVLDQASNVVPMKAGTAVQLSLPYVVHQLENAGTLPPDEDAVRAHANLVRQDRMAAAAAVVVAALVIQLEDEGRLPSGSLGALSLAGLEGCTMRAANERMVEFIKGLDTDEVTRGILRSGLKDVLGEELAHEVCDAR